MSGAYGSNGSNGRDLQLIGGACAIVVALLTGFGIPLSEHPKVALGAHLVALEGGIMLMVFGLAWRRVRLSKRMRSIAALLNVFGIYLLWAAYSYAAYYGSGRLLPMAAAGSEGNEAQEMTTAVILVTASVFALVGAMSVVVGLVRYREEKLKAQKKAGF